LQKIVEARQINVKVKTCNLNDIRKEEQRARSTRDANVRAGLRRQSEIAMNNQKLAIKLFTQKPTYQALDWEKKYKESREAVARLAKHVKVK